MPSKRIVTCWDYHHGQATRILVSGHPFVSGRTMAEKQRQFQKEADDLRAALCREPRGHRNMLGAIITEPVTEDAVVGVLFTSPDGYFDMCGDSSISLGGYLADSGLVSPPDGGTGTVETPIDTVAGRVVLKQKFDNSTLVDTTFRNVPSHLVEVTSLEVPDLGTFSVEVGYGGLTYAFFDAADLGFDSLLLSAMSDADQDRLIRTGTSLWLAARAGDFSRPIDLITISETLPDGAGFRVANFYAPGTMGRTPSGTGLSAHVAVEYGAGRLGLGQSIVHESILGLRFGGHCLETADSAEQNAVVPEISARSYLMGVQQIHFEEEDPFQSGFQIAT